MAIQRNVVGRGWGFPFGIDPTTGGVAKDRGDGIQQQIARVNASLRQILGTYRGEQFFRRRFGSRLRDLVFQRNTANLEQRLQFEFLRAIEDPIYGEPRIFVRSIVVDNSNPSSGRIDVVVEYTIRGTNVEGNMVYPYYLSGEERTAAETSLAQVI